MHASLQEMRKLVLESNARIEQLLTPRSAAKGKLAAKKASSAKKARGEEDDLPTTLTV